MSDRTLWLPVAAAVVAGAAAVIAAHRVTAAQERALGEQARTLEGLEERLAALRSETEADAGLDELVRDVDELRRRLEHLEREPRRSVEPAPTAPAEPTPAAGEDGPAGLAADAPDEDGSEVADAASRERRAELGALLDRLLGPGMDLEGDPADVERFWELVKSTGVVDERIAELEEQVAVHPADVELRMSLADTYIAKLFATPGGPEQGRWGGKAEEQWRAVIELDPDHWEAQFTYANNLAYYPDVMGMTGDAIAGLERAREIQERMAPAPAHVQTYLSLAQLYRRSNDTEEAVAALRAGLAFHPGDERLRAALAELEE